MTHPRVPPPSRPARRRDAAPARWRRRDFATVDDGVPDVENDDGARDRTRPNARGIFSRRSRLLDPPRDALDAERRGDGANHRWMSGEPRTRGFARAMGRFVASRGGCERRRDGGRRCEFRFFDSRRRRRRRPSRWWRGTEEDDVGRHRRRRRRARGGVRGGAPREERARGMRARWTRGGGNEGEAKAR